MVEKDNGFTGCFYNTLAALLPFVRVSIQRGEAGVSRFLGRREAPESDG